MIVGASELSDAEPGADRGHCDKKDGRGSAEYCDQSSGCRFEVII